MSRSRRGALILGRILAIAGLLFVLRGLVETWPLIAPRLARAPVASSLGLGALIAFGAALLLSIAWWRLLAASGEAVAPRTALRIFARSQIAKYVPGNVFHLVGRQVLGERLGLRRLPLASTVLTEALGLLVAAAAMGLFAWSRLPRVDFPRKGLWLGLGLGFLGVIAVSLTTRRWLDRHGRTELPTRLPALWLPPLALYGLFFAATGGILHLLIGALGAAAPLPLCVGLGALAWSLGFLTPGAPAGFGVRETVLVVGLTPSVGEEVALAAALLFRAATTLGDVALLLALGLGPIVAHPRSPPNDRRA